MDELYPEEMTELDLVWLAGFFDGEGSVGVYETGRKTEGKGKPAMKRGLFLHACITQKDTAPLIWCKSRWGGSLCMRKDTEDRFGTGVWNWSVNSRKAYAFLREIYPYLKFKKERVGICLEFQERKGGSGVRLTDEHREYERSVKEKIHLINRRVVS